MVKGQILEGDPSGYLPSCAICVSSLIYEVGGPFSVGPGADLQDPCECSSMHTITDKKTLSEVSQTLEGI